MILRRAILVMISAVTLCGCAQNRFNVPTELYADKVRVLGVAPIIMDAGSEITTPHRDLLIPLIADFNRKYEPLLVRRLQGTGNYYAVTLMGDEPQQLFSSLLSRRERRDDAAIQYNKYFWKKDDVTAYLRKNRLDALMVVVVSGLTRNSKIYSTSLLTSIETDFNFLILTAQVLGTDGTVLWEYPNFRGQLRPYYPLINLQYPDFSESEANLSRTTELRYKSIDGIRRTLEQKKTDLLLRETQEPDVYGRLFDDMTTLITHSASKKVSDEPVSGGGQPPTGDVPVKQDKPAIEKPAAASSPAAKSAPTEPPPKRSAPPAPPAAAKPAAAPPEIPPAGPIEIVPATGSTL